MLPKEFIYPRFEANQVLQSKHLNDLFEYLDEQNRLTRTNLIGVGIVCGLEVVPVGSTQLRITRGVGTPSAGYLITYGDTNGQLTDKTFARYREFTIPPDAPPYPSFYSDSTTQAYFPLWELVEGTPAGSQALTANFMSGNGNPANAKVVVLYVDLNEEKLKNCSPNSCDDKGNEVQVTFRPLLLRRQDADTMLERAAALTGGSSVSLPNLEAQFAEMRMRRFDVPATALGSTTQVIEAYRTVLTKDFIENTLKKNWSDAYSLLSSALTGISNDFLTWNPSYGADDKVILPEPYQYQYFYDLLSDLIQTYDELKREGSELLAVCCPHEDLFPRHLFLGLATENTAQTTSQYRHYFLPSPALGQAKGKVATIRALVQKAMSMLARFGVPAPSSLDKGNEIRITPSQLGPVPLSTKAIPYYYDVLSGDPGLLSLWNPERTRLGKAHHTLSYHAPTYPTSAPDFTLNPLRYDLEPYNFLRIEGHVGRPVRQVLTTLTQLRTSQRLPFDVVAIRTGNQLAPQDLKDLRVEDLCCCFDDLEVMYKLALLELRCLYAGSIRKLLPATNDRFSRRNIVTEWDIAQAKKSTTILENTLRTQSREIEELWAAFGNNAPHDVPIDEANLSTLDFDMQQIGLLALRQAYQLPTDLVGMEEYLAAFEDGTQRLIRAAEKVLGKAGTLPGEQAATYLERQRTLETLVRRCRQLIFKLLLKEYRERLEKVLQALLLSNYAQAHPGLQHKAGVPMGGTFVLVCHGVVEDTNVRRKVGTRLQRLTASYDLTDDVVAGGNEQNLEDELRAFLKELEDTRTTANASANEANIPAGMVFADFYLPYLCCSGCAPVVVFPPEKPVEEKPLDVQVGTPKCSEDNKKFEVELTISGGTAPYTVEGSDVVGSTYTLTLESGTSATVTVKDAGGQSRPVTVPAHTCEESCDLPCGGAATRCRYVFWMERPGIQDAFFHTGTNKADLNLPDYGVAFNFINEFNGIVPQDTILDTARFNEVMQALIKQLNETIRQKIGPDRFVMEYDPNDATLIIQHFDCEKFEFFIETTYILKSRDINQIIRYEYLPDQVRVTDVRAQETATIPAFGCAKANLCRQEEWKLVCQEGPRISDIKATMQRRTGECQFTFTPKTSFARCFWVFGRQAKPRYSDEKEPRIEVSPNVQAIEVRLLAITSDGCYAIHEQSVRPTVG